MESNMPAGIVFDAGSLFARFQTLSDKRKRIGLRYTLVLILLIIILAKRCGENCPSGIAERAKHRSEMLVDLFKLERKKMPHHTTYRRILADVMNVEELEKVYSGIKSIIGIIQLLHSTETVMTCAKK
jgi:hypothetical protein